MPIAVKEIDLWRTARILSRKYGEEAGLIAAKRADSLLVLGDLEGFDVWKGVVDSDRLH